MGAWPWGGHPTLSEYLTWAAKEAKCSVQTGYMIGDDGQSLSLTRVTAPSGSHVIIADLDQNERLVASYIAHLDRRLGLKSPWSL